MRFLVIGTWSPNDPNIPRLLAEEQHRTGELIQEGFVQQLLLRADGAGGYMLVSADSEAGAREHLDTLPFMKANVMRIDVVELVD
jgi:muconolactone delta-isomerase